MTGILYEHRETMLTPDELSSLQWKESWFYGTLLYAFVSPIYTYGMLRYAKSFPNYKSKASKIRNMNIISFVFVACTVAYTGNQYMK
jgi:hypothetical protein